MHVKALKFSTFVFLILRKILMSTFWQCFTYLGFVGLVFFSLCNLTSFDTKYF